MDISSFIVNEIQDLRTRILEKMEYGTYKTIEEYREAVGYMKALNDIIANVTSAPGRINQQLINQYQQKPEEDYATNEDAT